MQLCGYVGLDVLHGRNERTVGAAELRRTGQPQRLRNPRWWLGVVNNRAAAMSALVLRRVYLGAKLSEVPDLLWRASGSVMEAACSHACCWCAGHVVQSTAVIMHARTFRQSAWAACIVKVVCCVSCCVPCQ